MSSSKSRSTTGNQPRNCFICSGCVSNSTHTPKSSKSLDGAKLICQRFCSLASRYLTFRTKYMNPEVTLCQNIGEFGRFDDVVELCEACVHELRAFFGTYNELSLLQLRLNRKLKEIGELMKMRMPQLQGPRPGRKSERKSKSEEFKRTFLEQVEKIDKDFPQLRLERAEVDAPPRKESECATNTNVVVKQEQTEIVDDCECVEPERVTLPHFTEVDHDDDDHNYPGPEDDDDNQDYDQFDDGNFVAGTDSPQNADGSEDVIETPEFLEHDFVTGNRRKADTSLQCVYCGRQFSNRYSRMLHERLHTGERP